ncbi:AfsR/SARP family transcriptional regulator [Streptomyces sp. NPDC001795]|uniref:AfsR/SARP family transcriptional regulator n=1 Tax=unclassified Streptomyces TaxID=2593676 RepID=UPI00332262B3
MLYFKVLGPLEIDTADGKTQVRGVLQRKLLRTLLIKSSELVPSEALINELWGEEHPERVENALQAHISRIRRRLSSLEPERAASRLRTHISGYQLMVAEDEVDALWFLSSLERIRGRLDEDLPAAIRDLRAILDAWRSPVLPEGEGGVICKAAVSQYEESRLLAIETLFDAELRVGNHAGIVGELRGTLSRDRFHERFWQQLMTALYRSGRQSEALAAYQQLRRRLNDELGLEPSPSTSAFEQAILSHNPLLSLSSGAEIALAAAAPEPTAIDRWSSDGDPARHLSRR